MSVVTEAEATAERVGRSDWTERLARLGLFARGVVYVVLGFLAIQVARGRAGERADHEGALEQVAAQPYGRVLLVVVALGLAGYALWRFVQAFVDPEDKSDDAMGWPKRALYLGLGVIYSGLAMTAVRLVFRNSGDSAAAKSEPEVRGTAWLLSVPWGRWLVLMAGVALLGVAASNLWRAVSAKFMKTLKKAEMSPAERHVAGVLGRLGFLARTMVFSLIGLFLIKAAREFDAEEAVGLDGALHRLASEPNGALMLMVVAAGFVAFGVFSMVQVRYLRVLGENG